METNQEIKLIAKIKGNKMTELTTINLIKERNKYINLKIYIIIIWKKPIIADMKENFLH